MSEFRIALRNLDTYNPESYHAYVKRGGFQSFRKVLNTPPVRVIDLLVEANLRGRGGAGFSTGLKNRFTNEAVCQRCVQKYIVCNADEGEPGTFKDRIIMEKDPFVLIEGMLIAAYAIGATEGYIYIRAEYYESVKKLKNAVAQCYEHELLGKILDDSGFYLNMQIKLGAGSYLCGEELTLLESLEGKRGYPRIKPPFPAQKGLYGSPTLINNVETFAHIPYIVNNGAAAYLKIGTEGSPGTKIFTLSGDITTPGYVEVEMGTTLQTLIDEYGGGMSDGKSFQSALLGGAAGTFVDASVMDTPMGFDTLKEKGAILGSGAIFVLGSDRKLQDVLHSVLTFFQHESCGKCVPCRVGTVRLVQLLEGMDAKKHQETLDQMISEAEYMAKNSLCPLGQSPILPLQSIKKFFYNHF